MEYHQPDSRWEIFGLPDFETYQQKLVVKGLFHPSVPKDVVEAYEIAEYMMAHAYYHYPLYEEAFSKLLRITEMAVKLRCTQLGIELKKSCSSFNKNFSTLINDLCKAEPEKDFKEGLDRLRRLRNSFMHPDKHTYSGSMAKGAIQSTVTLLNEMFIAGKIFKQLLQQQESVEKQIYNYRNGLFVLEYMDKRYLIEGIEINAAILVSDKWIYYLVAHPISINICEDMKKHSYSMPLLYFVTDLSSGDNCITANEVENNDPVKITITDHRDNLVTYQKFVCERQQAAENDKTIYDHYMKDTIARKENEFWYKWLWKIDITSIS